MASPVTILTDEEILKLIECYRSQPILWDPKHRDFYDQCMKNYAWWQIYMKMKLYVPDEIIDVQDCKQKMESLVCFYRGEKWRTRILGKAFTSQWFAFDALRFLDNKIPSNSEQNIMKTKKDSDDDKERDSEPEQTVGEIIVLSLIPATSSQPHPNNVPKRALEEDSEHNSAPKKQNLTEGHVERNSAATSNTLDVPKPLPTNDEVTPFFAFVTAKVEKYSSRTKNAVEHAIFDILKKADAGGYESDP